MSTYNYLQSSAAAAADTDMPHSVDPEMGVTQIANIRPSQDIYRQLKVNLAIIISKIK